MFLTVVVEIDGADAAGMQRVQPLRDDFRLLAGKAVLPCRRLRGGSLPEDPGRLRFTLGFVLPPRGTRTVSLRAALPRLESEDVSELRLADLELDTSSQERRGPGWIVTVHRFLEGPYTPPALPAGGTFSMKGVPADTRVFRKAEPVGKAPGRAVLLSLASTDVELYDPVLDASGSLLVEGGAATPMLAAVMRRTPSRSVKEAALRPLVTGDFYFAVPAKGRATGAVLRLHRRSGSARGRTVRIDRLPVPGTP